MPSLPTIPLYDVLTPYHHIADNIPIKAIVEALTFVNDQVDNDAQILRESIGTQGSLANRLAQSINDDGSLKVDAIDDALHSIEEHTDSAGFVRMTAAERAKLTGIASDSTNLSVRFNTIDGIVLLDNGIIDVQPSSTITWRYQSGSVYADNNYPTEVRHVHYYGVNPIPVSDSLNNLYKTTTLTTAYKGNSLRVYINGVRLSKDATTPVPIHSGSSYVMTPYSFGEDLQSLEGIVTTALFRLSSILPAGNTIFIDFDVVF